MGYMIEWRSPSAGGKVTEIDADGMRLNTEFGWEEEMLSITFLLNMLVQWREIGTCGCKWLVSVSKPLLNRL